MYFDLTLDWVNTLSPEKYAEWLEQIRASDAPEVTHSSEDLAKLIEHNLSSAQDTNWP